MNHEYRNSAWIVIGKGKGWAAFHSLTNDTMPVRATYQQAQADAFNQNRIREEQIRKTQSGLDVWFK